MISTDRAGKAEDSIRERLTAAERYERVVRQCRPIRLVWCGDSKKSCEQLPDGALGEVASNEYQPGPVVIIGPTVETNGWMEDVLHAVDNDRRFRHFGKLHDTLYA